MVARHGHPALVLALLHPLVAGHRHLGARLLGLARDQLLPRIREQRLRPELEPAAPVVVERDVIRLEVVLPPHEDRLAGCADLLPVADVDDLEGSCEVDCRAQIHPEPGATQCSPEADGLAEQFPAVDLTSHAAPDGLHRHPGATVIPAPLPRPLRLAPWTSPAPPAGFTPRAAPSPAGRGRAGCPPRT